MKGILKKTVAGWFIWHQEKSDEIAAHFKSYVLHPDDAKICNQYGDYSVGWINTEVEFEIVHTWENGEVGVNGLTYATINKGRNLEQLETKLDNALAKESTESLTEWLSGKRRHPEAHFTVHDMVDFAKWIARDWFAVWDGNKLMWEYEKEVGPHHEYHGYFTEEQLLKFYLVDKNG